MRNVRKLFLAFVLVAAAVAVPAPQAEASHHWCLCDILCWDTGTQYCRQDECCRLECCDKSDPNCQCWL